MLVVGATGDAAELVLRRDGAEPLRAPFRAGEDEREAELPLARARGRRARPLARPACRVPEDVRLGAVGRRARRRTGCCASGPSAAATAGWSVVAEPLPPHAEARSVRVGGWRARGRRRRARPAAAPLVARHRGDGDEVAVDAERADAALHGAAAARPARPRRASGTCGSASCGSARTTTACPRKKEIVAFPGARGGRAGAPAVLHGRGQPLGARRPACAAAPRRRPSPGAESRRRRLLGGLAVAVHRLALGLVAALPRGAGAPPPRRGEPEVRVLLLHAYGLGGTVRTSFNLAAGLAGARRRADQPDAPPRGPVLPVPRAGRGASTTSAPPRRAGASRGCSAGCRACSSIPRTTPTRTRACGPTSRSCAALRAIRGGVLVTTRPAFNLLAARLAAPGRGHDRPGAHELHVAPAAPGGRPAPPLRRPGRAAVLTEADERDYAAALAGAPVRIERIPNAVPRDGRRHRDARRARSSSPPAGWSPRRASTC